MRSAVLIVTSLLAMNAFARSIAPTSFPLAYRTMVESEEVPAVRACAVAGEFVFEDRRADDKAGARSHEDKPSVKQPISLEGDVATWLREGVESLSDLAVLQRAGGERPRITIALAQLWLDEIVYRRAEFDARVVLDVVVTSADGSQTCYTDRVRGTAENYGYAGKKENYQETVNHALDRAVASVLSSELFISALCSCPSGGTE